MFLAEMQAEWARTMLQLTDTNLRSFNAALEIVVETARPKPKPASPFAALFGAADFSPANVGTANPFAPFFAMMTGGHDAGLFGGASNPWVQPWMASLWANTPWASLMANSAFGTNRLGANPLGSGFAGGSNIWNVNPWLQAWQWAQSNAGLASNPFLSGNSFLSGNPWGSLWQMPGIGNPYSPVAMLQGITNQAANAWLAAFQPRQVPVESPATWTWPLSGSTLRH